LAPDQEAPPRTGWARLKVELFVTDLDESLAFWRDLLGFRIAFSRPGFVYLERAEGAQIMLWRRDGGFETGPMERPFGRGVMVQVYVDALAPIAHRLSVREWPLHTPLREVWRRWGDREGGQLEFFVEDPDGYLVMVAETIGERPLTA
jgi:catechol 2,3-dioxygenase-like lactoylglutathione lyase family enzyme